VSVGSAFEDVVVVFEETSKNPVEHTFHLEEGKESPVLEILPTYVIKRCVKNGTLRALLANFGIRPEVTQIYSEI
jgi:hypothetical protein